MQTERDVFRALADPTRRAVFERLMRGEAAVGDLALRFEVSQPAISQHLGALRRAGLVRARREGRNAFYSAHPAGLRPLVHWIERYQPFWRERLESLKTVLEEMDE
jgi:DNA-binding transcriptional ArsR family regulator